MLEIQGIQQVFMLFYAIFWGAIFNVLPRWKAFHLPLFFKVPQARCRAIISVFLLNVLPLCFFAYGMWALYCNGPTVNSPFAGSLHYLIRGVLPAFAIFGFYHFWLAAIELHPDCFYASSTKAIIDKKYHHVEPTYRLELYKHDKRKGPVVDIGKDTGMMNFMVGLLYVVMATLAPWCPLP